MKSLILLSGGTGARMNQTVPKQFLMLAGKPLIMHTLERAEKIEQIDEIVIVCHKDYQGLVASYLDSYGIHTTCKIIPGGATRQESAYLGLKAAENAHVVIHEAARPFVKREEFEQLITLPEENVTMGCPIPFTVLKGPKKITGLLEREELVNIQLPQKFNRQMLLRAHELARKEGRVFTEDASLLYYYTKAEIAVHSGTVYNVKVTEPIDLVMGEVIYKEYIIGGD